MTNLRTTRPWLSSERYLEWASALSRTDFMVLAAIPLLLIVHRVAFEILGTGRTGTATVDALALFADILAVACCVIASRRAQGAPRIFWMLFAVAACLEILGNAGWAYCHYFHVAPPANSPFPSLFYRLAAAPMAIALFLSDDKHTSRLGSVLDSLMVVGLVGVTTYQLQMAELNAHDPKIWQLIGIGFAVNATLLTVAVLRWSLAPTGRIRGLFARQAIYLAVYLAIAFSTSLVDSYLPNIDDSFDLIWIVPSLLIVAMAITWRPPAHQETAPDPRISRRISLLCFNLTLATMVMGSALLGLRVVNSGRIIGLVAVTIVLFAFAVRSALLQDSQEKYLAALQKSRAELERQALYDELTRLPNRRLFAERLAQVLAIAEREAHMVALFYIDLDGFKNVNDTFGHATGDLLLTQVAQRMQSRVRKSDTIARVGGDEFTWLVGHLAGKQQASQLADEMLRTLNDPFQIDGNTVALTASIGIALYPQDAAGPSGLIQQADVAMYSVKRAGKNRVAYYTPEPELA